MSKMPLQVPLIVGGVIAIFKNRADHVADKVALRHQRSCRKHRRKRAELRPLNRARWAILSRIWSRWRERIVMVEACPFEAPGRFSFRDDDKNYGAYFKNRVDELGPEQVETAYRSPAKTPTQNDG